MSAGLLSVALPVRNGANFIAAALDSILAQDHADFTLHVSDNASDDETPAILADYALRDPRVKVSRTSVMISQMANMNRAVGLAQTPWVKLFCHDDLMRADCLSRLLTAIRRLEGTQVALIGNGEVHRFENGYQTPAPADGEVIVLPGREAIARKLWDVRRAVLFPAVTTATVRADAFRAVGGFDRRYVYFDLFCWLELLMRYDYAVEPCALTVNRIHGAQVAQLARRSLRELEDFRAFLPDFLARHGAALGAGLRQRMRVRLIPAALGARAVAVQLRAGRGRAALDMLGKVPAAYWPVMPVLLARAVAQEWRHARKMAAHVPMELLYPA